jgi:DmsE family decaheme c-type cytochrome
MGKKVWVLFAATLAFAGFVVTGPAAAVEKAGLVGMDTCATCHEEVAKAFASTPHINSAMGCEGCHGPGQAHVDGSGDKTKIRLFKDLKPADSSAVCMECHNKGGQNHWVGSTHDARKLACVTCHNPHPKGPAPKSLLAKPQAQLCVSCHPQRRAQLYRSGHMPQREGKMECTSCHNPHGTVGEAMLVQNTINENCWSCHAEKRGPFLWEHQPVREKCTTCHDAHGSVNSNMLKVKNPILCQQCHEAASHPSQPWSSTTQARSFNRGCLNCHGQIHGSNDPTTSHGGKTFWR